MISFNDINYQGLFTLYLLIAIGFISNSLSCELQNLINNSLLAKHLIGFISLYLFVILVNPSKNAKIVRAHV